jgi:hypothetical protein
MYRLSDDLAKLILQKMRIPKIHTEGERKDLFTPVDYRGIGVIDPICAVGTEFNFILESYIPIIYPELPHIPTLKGYFLYRKEELLRPMEKWLITRALIDPTVRDYTEQIDVSDCSVVLPSDTEKLTAKTVSSLERLIELCPDILDCLNLDK